MTSEQYHKENSEIFKTYNQLKQKIIDFKNKKPIQI